MYEATVAAVSGTRVYAGGKWLRCIGNKRVSVGDKIWTDGRCVYGHEQESQQPKVITAQEDEGIPIFINVSGIKHELYTFNKNRLKKIGDYAALPPTCFINDTKRKGYAGQLSLSSEFFIEGDVNSEHYFHYAYTVGVNIDKGGNVYELRAKCVQADKPTDINPIGGAHSYKEEIHIIKNGETILVRDLSKYLKQVAEEAVEKIGGFNEESPTIGFLLGSSLNVWSFIRYGAIENENSWAYIIELGAAADTERPDPNLPPPPASNPWGTHGIYYAGTKNILCLCTPDGDKIIANIGWFVVENTGDPNGTYDEHEISPPTEAIPIQDGYYFKINSLGESWKYGTVDTENVSIYNPAGKEIFRGDFPIGTYLTTHKGRLLGVDLRWKAADQSVKNAGIESGLYSIQHEKLTPLIEGSVRNWKLRPMERYRNWHKRIQKFPLELNEI